MKEYDFNKLIEKKEVLKDKIDEFTKKEIWYRF